MKVAASGGEPALATKVDTTNGDASHVFPTFLPDGRQFLYLSRPSNTLWLGTLDSSEAKRLLSSESQAFYADGHLLFARQGVLLAQPYDVGTATLRGDPTAIAEGLAVDSILGAPAFSSSETGVLMFRTGAGSSPTQLTWVDRSGNETGKIGPVGRYRNPVLSRDGTRIAFEASDTENRTQDLYVLRVSGGTPSRVTFARGNDIYPVWSPDDSRIAFGSDRRGGTYNLYEMMSSGSTGETLLLASTGDNLTGPYDWSPDGKFLLFRDLSPKTSIVNVGVLPLSGDRAITGLFPRSHFLQTLTQISPDGRWVAYNSNETGRMEVYVARFPNPGGKRLIKWRRRRCALARGQPGAFLLRGRRTNHGGAHLGDDHARSRHAGSTVQSPPARRSFNSHGLPGSVRRDRGRAAVPVERTRG
jgi:Tol biopolymer transport system component